MPQGIKPTVSIIIPTLNEEKALPKTLESIFQQTHIPHEIIIVDGGSDDATCDFIKKHPQIKLLCSNKKGRALQMNDGAAMATGEWLLFSHADTLLPKNAIESIQLLNSKQSDSGCFKQLFSQSGFLLNVISCLHNFRCRITHIMYGDQSIFIKRDVFNQLQGYKEGHMEDIKLSEELLSISQPVLLNDYVITDSRKFTQRGVLRSLIDVVVIIICYQLKKPIPNFSQSFFSDIR